MGVYLGTAGVPDRRQHLRRARMFTEMCPGTEYPEEARAPRRPLAARKGFPPKDFKRGR